MSRCLVRGGERGWKIICLIKRESSSLSSLESETLSKLKVLEAKGKLSLRFRQQITARASERRFNKQPSAGGPLSFGVLHKQTTIALGDPFERGWRIH